MRAYILARHIAPAPRDSTETMMDQTSAPALPTRSPALDGASDLAEEVIRRARKAGADAADLVLVESASLGVSWRLGRLEDIERSESRDLGLRVFVHGTTGAKRQAIVSATNLKPDSISELVSRVVAMARAAPEDPYCGLADPALLAREQPDLDLLDSEEPDADRLIAWSRAAEEAALSMPGVTNSEGAGASWGRGGVLLATSEGFLGRHSGSSFSISCSVLAGEGTGMERDYDHASTRFAADLPDPASIGRGAGEKAVGRLNPRKGRTTRAPVVFDPRVSNGLLGHFIGAINGAAIARGTSFLKSKRGEQIFAPGIRIVDDPLRRRGLRSKPFDGEGVATRRTALVEDGRLTTWILDSASARQLGLATTGNASRGTSAPPSPAPTNLYMEPGQVGPEDLIADIAEGFYVTELMGMGINGITGDYSRGAAGFWIKNGTLAYPVSEMTIAGNLLDMYRNLTPADDLVFRYGTNAPTLRVEGMTIAGS